MKGIEFIFLAVGAILGAYIRYKIIMLKLKAQPIEMMLYEYMN